ANANLEIIGVPRAQADAIRALSGAVRDGKIRFEKVVDSNAFLAQLSEIRGIEEWTTQWAAMRALREPDAFPSADRRLARALGLASSSELEQRSRAWCPWRSYAAMYLWAFTDEIRVVLRKNSIRLPSNGDAGTYLFGFSRARKPQNPILSVE